MSAGSIVLNQPGVYLVDVDGNAITVTDGLAIGSAEALIIAGKDGANARFVRVAADGTIRIDPTGTTTQPISAASLPLPTGAATAALQTQPGVDIGDVTVNNAVGAGAVNIQDGGNSITVDDGGGSITVDGPLTNAELRASAVPISAASLPLPTGAATSALQTQPGVDIGDVTVNNGPAGAAVNIQDGGNSITVDASSWPLPTGAATETTLATLLLNSTFNSRINTLGQKVMASSTPVVLASDQTVIPVSDNGGSLTVDTPQLPAALVGGRLDVNQGAWLGSTAPTVGQKTMASSLPVVIASDQSEVQVKQGTAAALAGAWPVKQTDGTNVMPTGDAIVRSVFQQISDGVTGPVKVTPASTAASASDKALVVTVSPFSAPITITNTPAGARTGVSYALKVLGGGTAGVIQIMRATTYTEPTGAAQRSVASSSASDTAAGVGARTVKITYYDNTGVGPLTETVTLNGTTPVNTVATNIRFIERMDVVTAGTSLFNVGTISLFGSTGGAGGTVGSIGVGNILSGVGDNSTLWAHHYVATGYTAQLSVLVLGIQSGGSATNGQFFVRSSQPLVANSAEIIVGDSVLTIGTFERAFTFNPNITGFARLTAYAIPGVNNATVSAAFDWSEVVS